MGTARTTTTPLQERDDSYAVRKAVEAAPDATLLVARRGITWRGDLALAQGQAVPGNRVTFTNAGVRGIELSTRIDGELIHGLSAGAFEAHDEPNPRLAAMRLELARLNDQLRQPHKYQPTEQQRQQDRVAIVRRVLDAYSTDAELAAAERTSRAQDYTDGGGPVDEHGRRIEGRVV